MRVFRSDIYTILLDLRALFERLPKEAKFALVLIFKSLIVSIVLGVLAGPATTVYAIRFGMRVPLEGVSYIQFTIGLWSFFAFIISILIVLCIIAIMGQLKFALRNIDEYVRNYRMTVNLTIGIDIIIALPIELSLRAIIEFGSAVAWIIKVAFFYTAIIFFGLSA